MLGSEQDFAGGQLPQYVVFNMVIYLSILYLKISKTKKSCEK